MTEYELRTAAMNWAIASSVSNATARQVVARAEEYLAFLKTKPAPTLLRVENGRAVRVKRKGL
jgi:hypothetical protein